MPDDVFSERNVIQIAGVTDRREADMLTGCGVDLLGFPLRIASGKEDLTESDAGDIIRLLRPSVRGVVITYLRDARRIWRLCENVGARIVQLHADLPVAMLAVLKRYSPDLRVIKSLIVREDNLSRLKTLIDQASPYVDAFITDTFDPATGTCGATGQTHDWHISRRLVEYSTRPVILAGGLNAGNVRQAIIETRAAGVDVHTGVEGNDGRKSRVLVERFVSEAWDGFDTP